MILKLAILLGFIYSLVKFNGRYLYKNTGYASLALLPVKDLEIVEISQKIRQTWHTPAMFLADVDKKRART